MDLPEIADFARNFAVMVRIQGPDPKGLKMRKHAFHHYQSGKTTLSASGFLLPDSFNDSPFVNHFLGDHHRSSPSVSALVVTVASLVEPFLSLQHRKKDPVSQFLPELIRGTQIDVLVERNNNHEQDKRTPSWLPSQLLAVVNVPASAVALQSLVEAPKGLPEHCSWEVGWSLASFNNGPHGSKDAVQTKVESGIRSSLESQGHATGEASDPKHIGMLNTRIAFLGISSFNPKDLPNIDASSPYKRGDLLIAVGSPFGILSPLHFLNSISAGCVANCYPPSADNSSLLMADLRCLPGMEGGPVFGAHAQLIGILSRPLRQRAGGAEIQLVIPWEALASVQSNSLQNEPIKVKGFAYEGNLNAAGEAYLSNGQDPTRQFNYINELSDSCSPPPSPIEKAMASITLITIDDGVWASGVVLNNCGLILTNAHLLEPWRFGKTTVEGGRDQTTSATASMFSGDSVYPHHEGRDDEEESQSLLPVVMNNLNTSVGDKLGLIYNGHKKIRVRLYHVEPWIWYDARVVYISKGPLDVALLQLNSFPSKLIPMVPDLGSPAPGSKAYVIGHGLFGPQRYHYPSVCCGVVARVVEARRPTSSNESDIQEKTSGHIPAMLETTAAVHPGGSGGAIVNSNGHMIGLVTSNARHGGGTVIPHLNFSIPCAALEPIFKFSKDTQDVSILQDLDKPNENLSSVWALTPSLSPKPVPPPFPHLPESLLEENVGEGKGSRFAKFIAERHRDTFRLPFQPRKTERLSRDIIPSKL